MKGKQQAALDAMLPSIDVSRLLLLALLMVLLVVLSGASLARIKQQSLLLTIIESYEDIVLKVAPSPERAYEYGVRHFNTNSSVFYSLPLAEQFLRKAARMDEGYPYLHHQLARVRFLQGNFAAAEYQATREIEIYGEAHDRAYYMRGLIRGYAQNYAGAEEDYRHFLQLHPLSWAAHADLAWILLKQEKNDEAIMVLSHGLSLHPDNPWLLNLNGAALYAAGYSKPALDSLQRAAEQVKKLTPAAWRLAYPGNDPSVAVTGIDTLVSSIGDNIHRVNASLQ